MGLFPEAALIKLASSMRDTLRSPRQIELRKLLLRRRTDRGVTQSELAMRLGKPQSFVAKYEGGERRLSVIEFIDVADALQIRPSHLLDELHEILKFSGQQEASIGSKTKTPGKH
jgi:transcriptional regulator with XRE-family HTH domain